MSPPGNHSKESERIKEPRLDSRGVPDTPLVRGVGLDTLQLMQDQFSSLGQVSVCICSIKGELVTKPAWGSRFSKMIGTSSRGQRELTTQLLQEAAHPNPVKPRACLHGMTLYSTLIRHGRKSLGRIVVGTRAPEWPGEDVIRQTAQAYELDPDDLVQATRELAANIGGTPDAAHRFADALADTIRMLYEQQERIGAQLRDLTTVHELSELLSGTLDLQEILNQTVRKVVEIMPVKASGIRLLNESTGELEIAAVYNLSDEYLGKGAVLLEDNVIDGAAFRGGCVYIEDAPTDPRIRYPENARKEGIVSGLCVPLTHRGSTVGVLRAYTGKRYRFKENEQALLRSIASQAASAIITSRLSESHARAEHVRQQMEAASEIQRRMLPAKPPQPNGFVFGCTYAPSLQVGGDFYDFITLSNEELGLCIADVMGKGIPAALLMASVRSALRARAHHGRALPDLLSDLNTHLCRDTMVGEFATLFYGVIDVNKKSLIYSNAGHLPPLLLRNNCFEPLETGGPVMGIIPNASFDCGTITLQTGDLLVLVTDGVTEALDFKGQAYGQARLEASVKKHQHFSAQSAQMVAKELLWDVRRFAGLADQSDDITIVVVKVL